MICPHCKKPIPFMKQRSVDPEIRRKAAEMIKQGYSYRDIEYALDRKISIGTLSRIAKSLK